MNWGESYQSNPRSRDAVSSETVKAPPRWQKQTWCAEQESRLDVMVYNLCRNATLCVRRRMPLQHLDSQKSWQSAARKESLSPSLRPVRKNLTVKMATSPMDLVFPSAFVGGMNAAHFDNFRYRQGKIWIPNCLLALNDGAPAHWNPTVPAPNTELKVLPSYSPFLNIVEQAISCLKAAIKAGILRPEIQRRMNDRVEARVRGIPLGEFWTQQLHEALHRNIDTITAAKNGQRYRFMQTYLPKCLNREVIKGKLKFIRK